MNITLFRIVKTKYADTAFDPNRQIYRPARWNPAGVQLIYTAMSEAGAILEILANVQDYELIKNNYSIIEAELDSELMTNLDSNVDQEETRRLYLNKEITQRVGEVWVESNESVALKVPSIVSKKDFNVLLNPRHDDFSNILVGEPEPVYLDPRLPFGT